MASFQFLVAVLSLSAGASGSAFVHRFAGPLRLMDTPNERSSHTLATPRGGGIGIVAASVAAAFMTTDWSFAVVIAAVGLFGAIEDAFGLPVGLRLPVHLVLASVATAQVLGVPLSANGFAAFVLWAVFIAGTANVYNFMDGINGMAGLAGGVGFALLAAFAFYFGAGAYTLPLAACAASIGFLPFNIPKARVFMGDTGSVFLGFLFASLVLRLTTGLESFLCMAAFLAPFYADSVTTVVLRLCRGENIFRAHRSHLYQYLSNEAGFAHWKVSLGYALAQLVFGALSLVLYAGGRTPWLVPVVFASFSAGVYWTVKGLPAGRRTRKPEGSL